MISIGCLVQPANGGVRAERLQNVAWQRGELPVAPPVSARWRASSHLTHTHKAQCRVIRWTPAAAQRFAVQKKAFANDIDGRDIRDGSAHVKGHHPYERTRTACGETQCVPGGRAFVLQLEAVLGPRGLAQLVCSRPTGTGHQRARRLSRPGWDGGAFAARTSVTLADGTGQTGC